MFNEYQWENYLKAGGDKTVKLFEEVMVFWRIKMFKSSCISTTNWIKG